MIADSFYQSVFQTFLQRIFTPDFLLFTFSLLRFYMQVLGICNQFFSCFRTACQNDVFQQHTESRFYIFIEYGRRRVHDPHVHAFVNRMIQEYGMHGLPHIIISTEREGKIADTAAHLRPRQVLLDPFHGTDKVKSVPVMFFHTGSDSQHIRIENNSVRIEIDFLPEETVSTSANLDLPFKRVCLPLFIKSHYDRSCTQLFDASGMLQENLFSFFQRNRIHNTFTLHAHQTFFDHLPFRRVDHHGNTGNIRFGCDQVQESRHLLHGIQHSVIHIDIDHLRAVFHLLAGNCQSLFIIFFLDQAQELT